MDVFRVVFEKARTDNVVFFLNFCGFLTLELYDPKTHKGEYNLPKNAKL